MEILERVKYDEKGLVPVVVQDYTTKDVLMLAYMNEESLKKTIETKVTWFYSRSRKSLWNKGQTSGNIQKVKGISCDCDGDTLLVEVEQVGFACHTGEKSCFYTEILQKEEAKSGSEVLTKLYGVIANRKENPKAGSYTNYLFDQGIDKILKKVGEETAEVIIGAKNNDQGELVYEVADLLYHVIVLLKEKEIPMEDIYQELALRFK